MENFNENDAERLGGEALLYNGIVRRKVENAEPYARLKMLNYSFVPQILEINNGYVYQKYEKGLSLAKLSRKAFSFPEVIVLIFKMIHILHILKKNHIDYGEISSDKFIFTDDDRLMIIGLGKGQNSTSKIFKFFKRFFVPVPVALSIAKFGSDKQFRKKAIKAVIPAVVTILLVIIFFGACRLYTSETFKFEETETTTEVGYQTTTENVAETSTESTSETETQAQTTTYIIQETTTETTTAESSTETTTDDGSWEMEIISGSQKNQNALIAIDNPDPNYKGHVVYVRGSERNILERLVMGEAGADYYAAALVAQCIRDAIVSDGYNSVTAVRRGLRYTGRITTPPPQSVKNAVAYIFDKGGNAIQHRILYFYAPRLVASSWHEEQQFMFGYCGHKYFDRTTDPNNKRIHTAGTYDTLSYVKQETETSTETTTEVSTEQTTVMYEQTKKIEKTTETTTETKPAEPKAKVEPSVEPKTTEPISEQSSEKTV